MTRPTNSVKPPKVLTRSRVLATLGICLCSTSQAALAGGDEERVALTLWPIALTGQSAQGTKGEFVSFASASLNDAGDVAFIGTYTPPFSNHGIWRKPIGQPLELVSSVEQIAPGVDLRFTGYRSLALTPDGSVGFEARVAVIGSSNNSGLWNSPPAGPTTLVAFEGLQAPGVAAGQVWSNFAFSQPGALGDIWGGRGNSLLWKVVFGSRGANSTRGIWVGSGSDLDLVTLDGDPASQAGLGFTFDTSLFGEPEDFRVNGLGTVFGVFSLFDAEGGRVTRNNYWIFDDQGPSPIVLPGDPAPGFPSGSNFGSSSAFSDLPLSINNAGQVAFVARAEGAPGAPSAFFGQGIWSGLPGSLSLVARVGSPLPGAPASALIESITTIGLDGDGALAITAELDDIEVVESIDYGISYGFPFQERLIWRRGMLAPGTDGIAFGSGGLEFPTLHLGPRDNALLRESLGMWRVDRGESTKLLLINGDTLDIDPSPSATDLRTISRIIIPSFSARSRGSEDSSGTFSLRNEVLVELHFTDGTSGLFVFDITPCPGDTNFDDIVNLTDLNAVLSNFGGGPDGDVTGDGVTDLADLNAVLAAFGTTCD